VDLIVDAGSITYQAQSPDESALVLAARDFGFVFKVTWSSTTGFLLYVKVYSMQILTLVCSNVASDALIRAVFQPGFHGT